MQENAFQIGLQDFQRGEGDIFLIEVIDHVHHGCLVVFRYNLDQGDGRGWFPLG